MKNCFWRSHALEIALLGAFARADIALRHRAVQRHLRAGLHGGVAVAEILEHRDRHAADRIGQPPQAVEIQRGAGLDGQVAQRLRDGVFGDLAALERAVSVGERQRQLTGRPVALTPVGVEPLEFAHRVAREREQGDLPVAEVYCRQHDNVRECIDVAGAVGIFRLLRVDARAGGRS